MAAGLALAAPAPAQSQTNRSPGIIPAPSQCELTEGSFAATAATKICWRSDTTRAAAEFLQRGLRERTGFDLALVGVPASGAPAGAITLELTPPTDPPPPAGAAEGYSLVVTPAGVALRAPASAGLFYGVQSLLQMVGATAPVPGKTLRLPAARIEDRPRFAWRGLMLDESRHFFGKATVKDLLDVMAGLKLNRFHWHLTDQPGWRVEIRQYPRLTEIGARGNFSDPQAAAAFYTQADIREIVAFAQARHIVIVPEIDMPGHATAACRAYPEVSGGGQGQWNGFTFNPAKEQTYVFLGNVLQELAALFPGPYFHIGGDEVSYGNQSWSTDPEILQFIRDRGLTNSVGLERYFIRRVAGMVHQLGKTAVGWDEIAGAGVPPAESVVMWWRHDKPRVLTQVLTAGYPVVLCPRLPCYFDFVQDASHQQGRRWNGFNDQARVYAFPEPAVNGLIPPGAEPNVLGVEACVWTERIQNRARLDFMTFPRLAALAEDGWTPAAAKNQAAFLERLRLYQRELERRQIHFFDGFDPARTPEPAGPKTKAQGTANG